MNVPMDLFVAFIRMTMLPFIEAIPIQINILKRTYVQTWVVSTVTTTICNWAQRHLSLLEMKYRNVVMRNFFLTCHYQKKNDIYAWYSLLLFVLCVYNFKLRCNWITFQWNDYQAISFHNHSHCIFHMIFRILITNIELYNWRHIELVLYSYLKDLSSSFILDCNYPNPNNGIFLNARCLLQSADDMYATRQSI